jgi:hypothetical protein
MLEGRLDEMLRSMNHNSGTYIAKYLAKERKMEALTQILYKYFKSLQNNTYTVNQVMGFIERVNLEFHLKYLALYIFY